MAISKSGQPILLLMIFAVVCVISAIALVYTKHESRKLFVELEQSIRPFHGEHADCPGIGPEFHELAVEPCVRAERELRIVPFAVTDDDAGRDANRVQHGVNRHR